MCSAFEQALRERLPRDVASVICSFIDRHVSEVTGKVALYKDPYAWMWAYLPAKRLPPLEHTSYIGGNVGLGLGFACWLHLVTQSQPPD